MPNSVYKSRLKSPPVPSTKSPGMGPKYTGNTSSPGARKSGRGTTKARPRRKLIYKTPVKVSQTLTAAKGGRKE